MVNNETETVNSVKPISYLITKYWITLVGCILALLLIIPMRLAIAYSQAPQPQAILTLGGDPTREQITAQLAQWYPSLEIWISSGPNPKETRELFQAVGIPLTRVHIDLRAVDTVTNFTSLVADFKQRHLQHLYLITSDYHMPRAKAIATIVLGSQGIVFTPVAVSSARSQESTFQLLRDIGRSLFWIVTGRTGASLKTG